MFVIVFVPRLGTRQIECLYCLQLLRQISVTASSKSSTEATRPQNQQRFAETMYQVKNKNCEFSFALVSIGFPSRLTAGSTPIKLDVSRSELTHVDAAVFSQWVCDGNKHQGQLIQGTW
jgi:hypothetical protein